MIRIEHNVETNEIKEIPLTEEEISDVLARQEAAKSKVAAIEQAENEIKAKRQTALAKLAALGLEEDDLKVLGL